LQEKLYALAQSVNGGRHVPSQNLHVTLAFLGSATHVQRACVEHGAEQVHTPPFDLTFDRLDCFRRRGLLWVGPSQVPAALRALAAAIARVQAGCVLAPEQRDYRPHVSLIRDLPHCPPPSTIDPIVWSVRTFALVRSVTAPDGSRYEVLRTWVLR
jgi:RNA 2',3'-cyclic 3'-phosphodiesterase